MPKYALIVVGTLVVASPAFADWFIVLDPDNQCRVVDERPTDESRLVVGDRTYGTRGEAERQARFLCREQ